MDWTSMSTLAASVLKHSGHLMPQSDSKWQEQITRARELREEGKLNESVKLYRSAIADAERILGEQSGEYWFLLVYLLSDLAHYLERKGLVAANDLHLFNARQTLVRLQELLLAD